MMESGATVITNAGGVNPEGLGRKLVEIARGMGLHLKVGVVSGDDILGRLTELRDGGDPLDNMETGEPLAPHLSRSRFGGTASRRGSRVIIFISAVAHRHRAPVATQRHDGLPLEQQTTRS